MNARVRGQLYSLPCGDDRQTTVFGLARCESAQHITRVSLEVLHHKEGEGEFVPMLPPNPTNPGYFDRALDTFWMGKGWKGCWRQGR